jgi:FkbM family methyltransferase
MIEEKKSQLLELLKLSKKKNLGKSWQRIMRQPILLPASKFIELFCRLVSKDQLMIAKTFWGDSMKVNFPEIVSCFIYRYGYFEEDLTEIFIKYLNEGDVFLDIGTHFGYYSMLGSHIVGERGSVHSFEPTLSTYLIAKSNLEGKKNVNINNVAAWSKADSLIIRDYGTQYSAFNSLLIAKLTDNISSKLKFKENKIEAISIDDYIKINKIFPTFVKIDAENAEYEILVGMEKTLQNIRPLISLEVGDVTAGDFKDSAASVNFLIAQNYKALEVKNGKLINHAPLKHYPHTNLLFIPN